MQKNLLQDLEQDQVSFYTKEAIMIGGCYGLQVHSNTYSFVMFTGGFCTATTAVAS